MKKKIHAICLGFITLNLQLITHNSLSQNVGINSDGSSGDSNTMLDIKATDNTSSTFGLKVKDAAGDAKIVVRSDGNVGVGTISPETQLHQFGNLATFRLEDALSPSGSITRTMAGLELITKSNTTNAQFPSAIKFMSSDNSFTTENPKLLAGIFPRPTQNYNSDDRGGMSINFATTTNSAGTSTVPEIRMTVDHTGNVGVGTTTPTALLEAAGSREATTSPIMAWGATRAIGHIDARSTDDFSLQRGGRITLSGDDGSLGGTEPYTMGMIQATRFNTTDAHAGATLEFWVNRWADGQLYKRMAILQSGEVGMGTDTPDAQLEVVTAATTNTRGIISTYYNNTSTQASRISMYRARGTEAAPTGVQTADGIGNLTFSGFNGTNFVSGASIQAVARENWGVGANGTSLQFLTSLNGGTIAERMRIDANGNVGIGTAVPTATLHVVGNICHTTGIAACSDIRYKKDIVPLSRSLKNIMNLQGVNYMWRQDEYPEQIFNDEEQIAFIAQEIEKVYPQLDVTDSEGYKSVNYSRLTPILVEAIKEQQQIIDNQKNKIENQEQEVKGLKVQNSEIIKRLNLLEKHLETSNK